MPAMLLRLITSFFRRRALVRRQADKLMASLGENSWSVARSRAQAMPPNSHRSALAWGVVRRIGKQLKIDWHPDTATRYLGKLKGGETLPSARQVSSYVPPPPGAEPRPEPARISAWPDRTPACPARNDRLSLHVGNEPFSCANPVDHAKLDRCSNP